MCKVTLSTEQQEKFIHLIEQNPCLYDHCISESRDKTLVINTWKKIAEEMAIDGFSWERCKMRWKHVRDYFNVVRKRLRTNQASGSCSKYVQKGLFYNQLQFIVDIKPEERTSNDFMISLVREVKQRPELYDIKHPGFSYGQKVDDAWKTIAKNLNVEDAAALKRRWFCLKNAFIESLQPETKSEPGNLSRHYLHDEMVFLLSHMLSQSKKGQNQGPNQDNPGSPPCPPLESSHSPLKRRRLSTDLEVEGDHDLELEQQHSPEIESAVSSISNSDENHIFNTKSQSELLQFIEEERKVHKDPTKSQSELLQFIEEERKVHKDPTKLQSELLQFIEEERKVHKDPTLQFFKGLLPQMNELSKLRRRRFLQHCTTELFKLLEEQDEEKSYSSLVP